MLHVAACLWDATKASQKFSLCYDESWAEKLYRGFARHLTMPFRFVLFTDRPRKFAEAIEQEPLERKPPDYGCMIEPFRLNVPTIIVGLDTILVRNIDHMAHYCLTQTRVALPDHPTKADYGYINAVAFVPAGNRAVYDEWRGENDMEWLRKRDVNDALKLWPGQILSFRLQIGKGKPLPDDVRIVYFHGEQKPHALHNERWVQKAWR